LADYQRHLGEFAALDTAVVGVSVDEAVRSERVRRQFGLTFPILCDPSRQTIQAWGLRDPGDRRDLALPTTVVVEQDGTLGMVAFDGVRFRTTLDAVLDRLRTGPAAPWRPLRWVQAWPWYWARCIANVGRFGMKQKQPTGERA
jgi:peroxiredoxin